MTERIQLDPLEPWVEIKTTKQDYQNADPKATRDHARSAAPNPSFRRGDS